MVVAHHLGGVTKNTKVPTDSLEEREWGGGGMGGLLPAPALFLVVLSHSEKKGSLGLTLIMQSRVTLNF